MGAGPDPGPADEWAAGSLDFGVAVIMVLGTGEVPVDPR